MYHLAGHVCYCPLKCDDGTLSLSVSGAGVEAVHVFLTGVFVQYSHGARLESEDHSDAPFPPKCHPRHRRSSFSCTLCSPPIVSPPCRLSGPVVLLPALAFPSYASSIIRRGLLPLAQGALVALLLSSLITGHAPALSGLVLLAFFLHLAPRGTPLLVSRLSFLPWSRSRGLYRLFA